MPMQLCATVCLNPLGWALIALAFLIVAAFSERVGWLVWALGSSCLLLTTGEEGSG